MLLPCHTQHHTDDNTSNQLVPSVAYSDLGPSYVSEGNPHLTIQTPTETSQIATAGHGTAIAAQAAPHLTYRDTNAQFAVPSNPEAEAAALRQAIQASQTDHADDEKRRLVCRAVAIQMFSHFTKADHILLAA